MVAFHSNQLSMRGTEVALFDYASHNESILNNSSVIVYDATSEHNDPQAMQRFADRFPVVAYHDRAELDGFLNRHSVDLLYAIKAGRKDGLTSKQVPTMVHAVFPTSPSQVHGASYAFISEWLSTQCANDQIACVPHIVTLPYEAGNLRLSLNIPDASLVIGSHGGQDNFNISCAINAVGYLLNHDPNIYFLGLNLTPFVSHPRAIFLPGTADLALKTRFINSCDVMLHARRQGESFGLACGEFSIRNKPVITYAYGKHTHHHDVLGARSFYYTDAPSLVSIVKGIDRELIKAQDWDCYTQRYNPERVMDLFDRHLIHPALNLEKKSEVGITAHWAYLKLKLKMRLNRLRPD